MYQNWTDLTFVHWEVDPGLLKSKLPSGLEVDTFKGKAYLSFVPFTMVGIRLAGMPAFPGLSAFHEWNLRTYVVGPHGPGVWFYSLEAANSPAVLFGRNWFKLPYYKAKMSLKREGRQRTYESLRLWPRPTAGHSLCASAFDEECGTLEPGTLDFWLVERYLLYSFSKGALFAGRVFHSPYEVSRAKLEGLDLDLLRSEGFEGLGEPIPLVHFSHGVSVEIFKLEPSLPVVGPR